MVILLVGGTLNTMTTTFHRNFEFTSTEASDEDDHWQLQMPQGVMVICQIWLLVFLFSISFLHEPPFRVFGPSRRSFLPELRVISASFSFSFSFFHFHSVFSFLPLTTDHPAEQTACNMYWNRHWHSFIHACFTGMYLIAQVCFQNRQKKVFFNFQRCSFRILTLSNRKKIFCIQHSKIEIK